MHPPRTVEQVRDRITHLRTLPDGWLDGEGKALSPDGLDWVQEVLLSEMAKGLTGPFLYPGGDVEEYGDVGAEWSGENRMEYSWHFFLDRRAVTFYAHDMKKQSNDEGAYAYWEVPADGLYDAWVTIEQRGCI